MRPRRRADYFLGRNGLAIINRLEVSAKLSNRRARQSLMSERRSTTSGNRTTRTVTIRAHEFKMGEEAKNAPHTLLVRCPQDTNRERVRFKLNALDLL
jgi:hypothetical protein